MRVSGLVTSVLGGALALGFAAALLVVPAAAAGPSAYFGNFSGGTLTYNEIVSQDSGSPVPCLATSNSALGCSDTTDGFYAWDLNGNGTNVAGTLHYFSSTNSGLSSQAAVWFPGQAGVVLLDDNSEATSQNFGESSREDLSETASFAFDLTASTSAPTVVGMAQGVYVDCGFLALCGFIGGGSEVALPPGTGVAQDIECEGPCFASPWFLPIQWLPNGGGAWQTGEVMAMVDQDSGDANIGGAFAISDNGSFAAGWNGSLEDFGVDNIEAVRWSGNFLTTTPTEIGYLFNGDNASVANDVNSAGQTVGWSGVLNSSDSGYSITFGNADTAFGPRQLNPDGEWDPKPFVYTDTLGIAALNLTQPDSVPTPTTFSFGDALAISEGGKTAVGWVQNNLDLVDEGEVLLHASAWLDTGVETPWETSELVVLPTPEATGRPGVDGAVGTVGAVANAVDASGEFIAGTVLYTSDQSDELSPLDSPFMQAAYWVLDGDQVVESGTLQAALVAAGVPMDNADLFLTQATAVRVQLDAQGNPQTMYITGTGTGSFGSWIAALAAPAAPGGTTPPPPGITTPDSVLQSLDVAALGAFDFTTQLGVEVQNQKCIRPNGTSVDDNPWCFFGVGSAGVDSNSGATSVDLAKQIGVARYFDADTSVGISGGLNWLYGQVPGASSYSALTAMIGAYAAHEPQTGLRVYGSAMLGKLLDATFTRVYVNGSSTASSTGSTTGYGFGVLGELGYGIAVNDKTRLVPFVRGKYAMSAVDGWTDTGGPFPATINPVSLSRIDLTAGIKVEHDLSPTKHIFASADWTLTQTQGSVSATVAGLGFGVPIANGNTGLLTLAAGGRMELDETSNIWAQMSLSTNLGGYVGAKAMAGYDKSF